MNIQIPDKEYHRWKSCHTAWLKANFHDGFAAAENHEVTLVQTVIRLLRADAKQFAEWSELATNRRSRMHILLKPRRTAAAGGAR